VKATINENVEVPAGYWIEYGGTFQQLESAAERLALVVPLMLLVFAMLLFLALGSLRDAAVVSSVSFERRAMT
jgi:cobalt-zinc-cadmium resistance protein CzcA